MMVIFKYQLQLEVGVEQTFEMPRHATIISLQNQRENICIWALVNSSNQPEERTFVIVGTGHPIHFSTAAFKHVDTVQMLGGDFVWHIFERMVPGTYRSPQPEFCPVTGADLSQMSGAAGGSREFKNKGEYFP